MPGANHQSGEVVREFVRRLNTGQDPLSLLTDAAVVTINGTTPLSGRYAGLTLVRGILVDTARNVISTLAVEIRSLIGSGSRIATLLAVSGRNVDGMEFNREGAVCGCVFTVNGGRIEEIILFPDTSLIETALYRRRYVANA